MLESVPDGTRVLDIGCASGYVAAELTARGCTVIGLDPDEESARLAESHCAEVIVGDVERGDVRGRLPHEIDVVLFGDVLEHLRDPGAALAGMHDVLREGGFVVASIPNIGVWFARVQVALGRFPYADHGIFDRTHLRFFTRTSVLELARDAGYAVVNERFAWTYLPAELTVNRLLGGEGEAEWAWLDAVKRWAANHRPELFALQFVLTLAPRRTAPGISPG